MNRTYIAGIAVVAAAVLSEWTGLAGRSQTPQASNVVQSAPKEPSNQEINDAFVQQISKQIAGREQEPSGQVFKNIQVDVLKKTPAARLLLIMIRGVQQGIGGQLQTLPRGR